MSTIKSSDEHLTLNADGSSKDIKFQANGVQKASISSAGAFTSTTIDATALTGALPALDGSSLTGVGGGKILQVVSVIDDGVGNVDTTSTSYVATGYSVTITPSATTSKIRLDYSSVGFCGTSNNDESHYSFFRGSTRIGDGSSTCLQEHGGAFGWSPTPIVYIDSPSTTSATTYSVKFKSNQGQTVYAARDGNSVALIATEIGA